jgi:hypothetical protein
MTEQNKSTPLSQEDILKLLQQVKVDLNILTKQVKQIKAKDEVEAFFEIPEILAE